MPRSPNYSQKQDSDACCWGGYNLGQNKMEQQTSIPPRPPTPPPQIKDEAEQKPKRAIFPSLIWRGEGVGRGYKFV